MKSAIILLIASLILSLHAHADIYFVMCPEEITKKIKNNDQTTLDNIKLRLGKVKAKQHLYLTKSEALATINGYKNYSELMDAVIDGKLKLSNTVNAEMEQVEKLGRDYVRAANEDGLAHCALIADIEL